MSSQLYCAACRRYWPVSDDSVAIPRCPVHMSILRFRKTDKVRKIARGRRNYKISAEKRRRIYARDGHCCVRCGATNNLTIDHIKKRADGGGDGYDNLRTMCVSCNSSRDKWEALEGALA